MQGYVLLLLLVIIIIIIVLTILIVNQNKKSSQKGGGKSVNNTQLGSGNAKKGTYTVQSGDGCEAIASKLCGGDGKNYGQVLCDANCANLQPGQQIKYNCNGCKPKKGTYTVGNGDSCFNIAQNLCGDGTNYSKVLCVDDCDGLQPGEEIDYDCTDICCKKVGTGIISGPNSDLVSQYCTWQSTRFPLDEHSCENIAKKTCGYVPENKNTIAENVAWQGKSIFDSELQSVVTGSASGNEAKEFCAKLPSMNAGDLPWINFNCKWDTACGGHAGGTEHGACPTGPKDSWSTK